jgi:hypothetical protein
MMAKLAGRNGAGVRVGGRRRVGEGRGVAVGAGRGLRVEVAGAGLAPGMDAGVVLCKLGGVRAGSLAELQARQNKTVPKRRPMSRVRVFIIDALL